MLKRHDRRLWGGFDPPASKSLVKRRCTMVFGHIRSTVIGLGMALFTGLSIAQAQTPFDVTECGAGPVTIVFNNKEVTISGLEGKGIFFSNHENKIFDNFTFQVVAIAKVEEGKRRSDSYWKIVDSDGDVIIAQGMAIGHEKTLKLLRGTGKWKGIKGEAKGKIAAVGKDKSLMPGSFQACSRYIGSFDLPK
jgi:ABC-type Fe3+-hydroxamate transport system substrate-binding protein